MLIWLITRSQQLIVESTTYRVYLRDGGEKMKLLPKWFYDERQQIGTDYSDAKEVEEYDLRMQKIRNVKLEIKEIKVAINLNKDCSVLEIGTGTGELAIEVSKHCKEVVAIDVSAAMIEFAQKKANAQGRDNITFINAGFLSYTPQEKKFDAAVSQLALHHLPDFWKMIALQRINEVLKDDGKLYLRDVVFPSEVDDYGSLFNQIINGMRNSAGEVMAKEIELHIKEEFSTFDWIMEGLLKRTGFSIKSKEFQNGFIATYVCSKPWREN